MLIRFQSPLLSSRLNHMDLTRRCWITGDLASLTLPPNPEIVRSLSLADNNLISISPDQLPFASLATLVLDNNRFAQNTLPDSICNLTTLTTLSAANCQLSSLPPSISRLHNLQTMFLHDNQFHSTIFNSLLAMEGLSDICLDYNNLSTVPPIIGQFSSLKRLRLRGNQISSLPTTEIAHLTQLVELDVSYNQLATLPKELGLLAASYNLKGFSCSNNPFAYPLDVIESGNVRRRNTNYNGDERGIALLEFLKQFYRWNSVHLVGLKPSEPLSPGLVCLHPSCNNFSIFSHPLTTLQFQNDDKTQIQLNNKWEYSSLLQVLFISHLNSLFSSLFFINILY